MPTLQRFSESLPCKLTEEELLLKGKGLSEICEEIAAVENEKSAVQKHFNGRLGELETKRSDLARIVRSGEERRPVDCLDQVVRDDKSVVTIRLDTGEKIRSRPARDDELYKAPSLFEKADDEAQPFGKKVEPPAPEPIGPESEQ